MTLAAYREERAALKRRDILDAARTLFAEQGLSAVSMAALAAAARVSTATLYRYFNAKEDVFAEVVDELVAGFSSEDTGKEGTDTGLRALALRYARLLSDPVVLGLLRAVVADHGQSSGFRERLDHHGNAMLLRDFDAEISLAFAAAGLPLAAESRVQATLELRGALEHISLIPGLLFHESLPADSLARQVSRIVDSWERHWLQNRSGLIDGY